MATLTHLKILISDDNPHMRTILTGVLHAVGIKSVTQACDGAEALALLGSYPVDIAIVDFNMRPMNGVEFTKSVRRLGSPNPFLPIIMVTGYSAKKEVCLARDAGVTEFLAKPITAAGIIQRLDLVIFKPRPFITHDSYFGPDRRRRPREGEANRGRRATDI